MSLVVPVPCCAGETYEQYGLTGCPDSTDRTVIRRWCVEADQVVPDLDQVLGKAGLSSYVSAANAWCEENGAAVLSEVWEELDDLGSALGLTQSQGRQLYVTLGACVQKEQSPLMGAGALQQCSSAMPALVRTDSEFHAKEEQEVVGQGQPGVECELKTGLRGAMVDAGLQGHVAAAEAWCCEMGAAFLEEVLEEIDTVCKDLHLSQQQHWEFQHVLEHYVTRDGSRWTGTLCGWDGNETGWQTATPMVA